MEYLSHLLSSGYTYMQAYVMSQKNERTHGKTMPA